MSVSEMRDRKLLVARIKSQTDELNKSIEKWCSLDDTSIRVQQEDEDIGRLDPQPRIVVRCFEEITDF